MVLDKKGLERQGWKFEEVPGWPENHSPQTATKGIYEATFNWQEGTIEIYRQGSHDYLYNGFCTTMEEFRAICGFLNIR